MTFSTPFNIALGQNLRCWRVAAGLSQKQVGRYLGVSFQQIQKYEKGDSAPSCEKLVWLCALFRCTLQDLCPPLSNSFNSAQDAPQNTPVINLLLQFNRLPCPTLQAQACELLGRIADMVILCDR